MTGAPCSGKMALEAGDMEDGQLSDSDSDMTVAPSDRPLQVPVSVKGERVAGRAQSPSPEAPACGGKGAPGDWAAERAGEPEGD